MDRNGRKTRRIPDGLSDRLCKLLIGAKSNVSSGSNARADLILGRRPRPMAAPRRIAVDGGPEVPIALFARLMTQG
jgi:hypothetical protein